MNRKLTSMVILTLALAIVACGPSEKTVELQKKAKLNFGIFPDKAPGSEKDTAEQIALGKKLYFDTILSENKTQSCNSCHNIDGKAAGVDNLPTSPGAFGKNGDRNSPTVLNAAFHVKQFWDGRADDLKAQAKGPILNPVEMAMPSEAAVLERLKESPEYPAMFNKAFGKDSITYDNLAEAISAFERTLITRDRLSDFIAGDHSALSSAEQEGLELFLNSGCNSCHNGVVLGGNSFRKLGQVNPYETKDLGMFSLTKKPEDKYMFKVSSLKNIALTAPYFHDGSVKTLEEAIKKMGYHQLGKEFSDEEVEKISKFLNALSDKNRL
ncbi:MAG: cytochrome-c peroxidase [Leptospira sp.]|nr:cytochrome-c peroxidase [Leptospira sp.]NCS93253.1 cytochrome-c peroxidase [Leptospira sp.]